MIQITNVQKKLNGKDILRDINLELKKGECISVTGYNGCGKTMLLRLICGLIKPTNGEVKYENDYKFGVIIENPTFFMNETGLYNLKYLAGINKIINEKTINDYLKIFNLYDVRNKKVSTYSLGMKQRLALCQAFMENPDIILLDEPFNALDEKNLSILCDIIQQEKEKGKIIVIAAHGEIPKKCGVNRVLKMEDGKIL
ncbi:MAG: ABC transporter ATP-binding protein [Clostridia bacterium]|nr:ABC transporter ATP-binding protein [Clostridia bacterium]